MKNIRPAFEVWEEGISEFLQGYQNITCHVIFDVKTGNSFRRKALFVADGHKTKTSAAMTYSPVVSRESVRIAPKIAALNELEVLACNIQNTYLKADCRERVWVVAGTDFGSEAGKNMLARKALYGSKRSGAAFRDFLAENLNAMGYRPRYSNPNLWLWSEVNPDSFDYYEYIPLYIGDVLCIYHNPWK